MSVESTLGRCQEEDVQFLIRKVEEKKRMLGEAEVEFSRLCAKLDKINSELDGLKLESFAVEGLIRKLDSRVKVYEQEEKELKEQDERAKRSIEEAKYQLTQELDVRAAFDRHFSEKITSMATEYCHFKESCLKTKVHANLQNLKSSEEAYTAEICSKLQNFRLGPPAWQVNGDVEYLSTLLQQIHQPSTMDSDEVAGIRELKAQIQEEYKLVAAKNAEAASQIDRLLMQKSNLVKELNSLKKTWNK